MMIDIWSHRSEMSRCIEFTLVYRDGTYFTEKVVRISEAAVESRDIQAARLICGELISAAREMAMETPTTMYEWERLINSKVMNVSTVPVSNSSYISELDIVALKAFSDVLGVIAKLNPTGPEGWYNVVERASYRHAMLVMVGLLEPFTHPTYIRGQNLELY